MRFKHIAVFLLLLLLNPAILSAKQADSKKSPQKASEVKEKSPLEYWSKRELELNKSKVALSGKRKYRLGISQSVEIALQNNLEHKMYLLQRDMAEINVARARRNFYPVISATTKIQNMKDDTYKEPIPYNTHSFILKQPIYYFGELSNNLRANQAKKMASMFRVVNNAMSLETKVVTSYMNILKTQKSLEINKKFIKKVKNQLTYSKLKGSDSENKEKKEGKSRAKHRWNVLLKTYQQNAVLLENKLIDNQLKFNLLLQFEPSTKVEVISFGREEFDIDYEEYLKNVRIYSPDEYIDLIVQYALTVNPEINVYDYRIKASEYDLRKQEAYNMPKIDFTPYHKCGGNNIPRWHIGVTVTFNVFNTGNWEDVIAKKKQLEVQKLRKEIFIRDMKAQIRSFFFKQTALMKQVYLKLAQSEEAYLYFEETMKKYNEGKVDEATLVDAYDELYSNQLSGIDALYDYYIEKQRFHETIGFSDFFQTPSLREFVEKKGKVPLRREVGVGGKIFNLVNHGDIKMVSKLLDKDPTIVNNRNESKWTPLHLACFKGNIEMVKLLLEKGADINAKSRTGMTPVYLAATKGNYKIVLLLADKGANINIPANNSEWTPLMRACSKGYFKTAEVLVKYGADINAKSKAGWTPLHGAAEQGHLKIVELLVNAGADVNIKNNLGRTPLDLAIEDNHERVISYLEKHGAKKKRETRREVR